MEFLLNNKIKKELSPNCKKKLAAIDLKRKNKDDRSSPSDDKCPICLVIPIENKSFANRCFHSFCKFCIVEWAKVRMECPLCRQPFDRIIYDVKSEYDFKELTIEDLARIKFNSSSHSSAAVPILSPFLNMFTLSIRNASAILADQIANRTLEVGTVEHRRYIYASDQYVMPCGNGNTSRRREANARFFRSNPACAHRLIPFLNLELRALIHNQNERNILMQLIIKSLPSIDINSSRFQQLISQFTVHRTVHFIHELYNYAISTYDNIGLYFRDAIYVPRSQTTVVRINYNEENSYEGFDLSDPYNYRNSRRVYNDLNDGPFVNRGNSSSRSSENPPNRNKTLSTNHNNNISTTGQIQNLPDSDVDSDIDIIYEGTFNSSSKQATVHDVVNFDELANRGANPQTGSNSHAEAEPKPSTSGLQNNRTLSTSTQNQLGQYDSDSDYDDDVYRRRLPRPFYESDEDRTENTNRLRGDLDDNSIEYVGFVRSKRLRTSDSNIELIELTDDEESNDSTNKQMNVSKKLKVEHNNDKPSIEHEIQPSASSKDKAVNCRCKVMCRYVCKKEDFSGN